ncbi:YtrH family sporulation protein [Bacillus sp. JJ1533]|uniref:YtrH family sporulation protein n=1 Tax=Bacillales TaxID=1385 RepID=UPI0030004000
MEIKDAFMPAFIHSFFIALGVLLGGSLIGGLGAFISGQAPLSEIYSVASKLKIWALVAAIGGTFDTFYSFEKGIFLGQTKDVFKQFLLIISAMGGAQFGWRIIEWFTQEHIT